MSSARPQFGNLAASTGSVSVRFGSVSDSGILIQSSQHTFTWRSSRYVFTSVKLSDAKPLTVQQGTGNTSTRQLS